MKNPFNLSKNLVSIDIETSGIDKSKDRIIQISGVKFTNKWKKVSEFNKYILPNEPWEMTPEAEEVHGLTKKFIEENGVPLKSIYNEWIDFLGDCDIITYNGNSFDIPFLYTEFQKSGLDPKIMGHKLIDVFKIETKVNSNTLSSTYTRYTGKPALNAHNALSDVNMTMRVFYEQLNKYPITDYITLKEMQMDFPDQILKLNEDKKIQFTGGKHKDELVFDVCKKDPSYIQWLFKNVVSKYSKEKIIEEYNNLK